MATPDLTTYPGMVEGVQLWLNRYDLAEQAPAFIQLAEAGLNRELRVRDMLTRVYYASDANFPEFAPLPVDFLETYTLAENPDGQAPEHPFVYIGQKDAQYFKAMQMQPPSRYYSIVDQAFEIIPAPTTPLDLKLTYYARLPPIAAQTTTRNWLSIKSPDLYLFSALVEASPYLNDDSRTQVWVSRRAALMEAINIESERSMRPRTQLTARARPLDGVVPTTVWPW